MINATPVTPSTTALYRGVVQMAGWTKDHKIAIIVAVIGLVGAITAALITGMLASDTNDIHQRTGKDGNICINSQC
ncbi:hypothetical protein [Streptomyces bungoensis]|uniref:hypothetical protein n=1 Tax=Streptomyces bungoensis TaxID=285568 RepID=UPI0033EF5AC1